MDTISGLFCPVCKFKNNLNATVCAFCGASLEGMQKGETTTRRVDNETKNLESDAQKGELLLKELLPARGVAIYAEDGSLIEIREEKEFFVGRKTEPDEAALLDLTAAGAFQKGVSRRHAVIRQTQWGHEITDLESTNGTFLEGNRLVANRPYPLPSASRVSLGRMHLVILCAQPKASD